jgi:uncharacterized protein (TIGR02147 family)
MSCHPHFQVSFISLLKKIVQIGVQFVSYLRYPQVMKTQGQFLNKFYKGFQKDRPALSQRAFAKFLGLPPQRLHDFMSDKRVLTLSLAEQVLTRLKLSPEDKQQFLSVVTLQRKRSRKKKNPTITISLDDFRKISDSYHFAILALADTVDFESDPAWISSRLDLDTKTVHKALTGLTSLGFLNKIDGAYILNNTHIETENDIPSEDLRSSHKQSLNKVISLLDRIDISARELQSITFAGDPQKLKLAKTLIRNFTHKVVSILESGKRTEVYELNVQLFPISKRDELNP